jgi:hypothetical protein
LPNDGHFSRLRQADQVGTAALIVALRRLDVVLTSTFSYWLFVLVPGRLKLGSRQLKQSRGQLPRPGLQTAARSPG